MLDWIAGITLYLVGSAMEKQEKAEWEAQQEERRQQQEAQEAAERKARQEAQEQHMIEEIVKCVKERQAAESEPKPTPQPQPENSLLSRLEQDVKRIRN